MSTEDTRRLVLELLGEGATQVELPRSGVLTIGSVASKVGFAVQGQGVSDVHCAIGRAKGGGFALKDLGSEYGTWVNGERVQQAKLDAGDQILVGSRRLRVVDPSAPVVPAPAPSASPVAPSASPAARAATPANAPMPATAKPASLATNYEQSPLPKVPGYRIEKLLGRGGMGEVFLATQERLDRKVALKLLSSKLCADADFVRRFKDEARVAASLTHPNVVVVHDVGEAHGRHFLSMEYMDRGTLEERLARDGRMGWLEVLGVLHDMSSALVYAEGRGIVHRDLKPANMMQGSAGATRLADLGLATHLEAEASESDGGRIFGTPHFISPEQARGERVDSRSDLYSLGATAYRLLSGRTPFEGATTRDILRGHFFDKPKPLAEMDPEFPAELVRIIERLLEKKPDDRYPSAAVLLQEVDRVRATLLHNAGPAQASGVSLKLVGGAAVVIAAIAAVWWFNRPAEPTIVPPPKIAADTAPDSAEVGGPDENLPTPIRNGVVRDDDTHLKLLEAQAKLAWRDLPTDLAAADRIARLGELAAQYAGTSAAVEMQAEASQLQAGLNEALAANAAQLERRRSGLAVLESILSSHPDSMFAALEALNASDVPADITEDMIYLKGRADIYRRVLLREQQAVDASLGEIDAGAARGDFADVAMRIDAILERLRLPRLSEDIEAAVALELSALKKSASDLTARRAGLEAEGARLATTRSDADRLRLATELGYAGGFKRELRALDFRAMSARLSGLRAALSTEPALTLVRDLETDIARCEAALKSLAREFSAGGWKRKQISDPRGNRGAVRNALAADDSGITLDVDGKPELVPWSEFGGRPDRLNFLFNERLNRAYTPDEALGIEALMRTAAVLSAIDSAREMFDGKGGARFDGGEVRELNEAFEIGRAWATLAGSSARFERESQAASILAQSLVDASSDAWSLSVSGIDRLMREFGDTQLVRMLSDGSPPATR